jgi:hypothetical protein
MVEKGGCSYDLGVHVEQSEKGLLLTNEHIHISSRIFSQPFR